MSCRLKKGVKSGNIGSMKKVFTFLLCAVLLIGVVRVISLRYQDRPEEFAGVQEWIDIGKEKAEEVTDFFATQISGQEWDLEGNYDIDTETWFDEEEDIYSGSREHILLSEGVVKHLTLQAAGCKVVTVVVNEPAFYLSFENMKKVQAYQKDNSLFVKAVRDTLIDKDEKENLLILYIPADLWLDSMELELGAGSMQLESLKARRLDVSVEAGKLTLDGVESGELTVSLGAGMVSMDQVNAQDMKLSAGAGSMEIDGLITGNVEADCAMGNIQMNLQGNKKDFNYELQCMAGNIVLEDEKHSGINEEMLIDHAASKDMKLNCTMGNIKIVFGQ